MLLIKPFSNAKNLKIGNGLYHLSVNFADALQPLLRLAISPWYLPRKHRTALRENCCHLFLKRMAWRASLLLEAPAFSDLLAHMCGAFNVAQTGEQARHRENCN